jgi:hypothetical protein
MSQQSYRVYLVRHAQAEHNISKDNTQHDPPLTETGRRQASSLTKTFPHRDRVAVVLTSPLRRAVETSLCGFGDMLDFTTPFDGSDFGARARPGCARLIVYPDIQPRSETKICDVPSAPGFLSQVFPTVRFEGVGVGEWWRKEGAYADDDGAIADRGLKVRRHLWELASALEEEGGERKDIVLVTHGVMADILTGRKPKGWDWGGCAGYSMIKDGNGEIRLEPDVGVGA